MKYGLVIGLYSHRYYAEYFELLAYSYRLLYAKNRYCSGDKSKSLDLESEIINGRLVDLEAFIKGFMTNNGNCGNYLV